MKIDVTDKDIAAGKPCCSDSCAVTLALRRATGETWLVDGVFRGPKFVIPIPARVSEFIEAFDAGETVEPFSFELKVKG